MALSQTLLAPQVLLELAALGLFTGFLAGVLGIGGGMLSVPFVVHLLTTRAVSEDLAVKMAIATSMASIAFISLSNVRAQHKRGAIRWDLFRNIAPGIVVGALINSLGLFAFVKGQWLSIFFGLFVGYTATKILIDTKRPQHKPLPPVPRQMLTGVFIGLISGLVGAGGGFISVAYLNKRGVPIHNAIATSAALGMPIAIFNTLGFIATGWGRSDLPPGALGFVFLPALVVLAIASSAMAPIGVHVSHKVPVHTLKKVFAGLLYALSLYMMYKGLGPHAAQT